MFTPEQVSNLEQSMWDQFPFVVGRYVDEICSNKEGSFYFVAMRSDTGPGVVEFCVVVDWCATHAPYVQYELETMFHRNDFPILEFKYDPEPDKYGHLQDGTIIEPPAGWKILPKFMQVPHVHREFLQGANNHPCQWTDPRRTISTMTPIWANLWGSVRAIAVPIERNIAELKNWETEAKKRLNPIKGYFSGFM